MAPNQENTKESRPADNTGKFKLIPLFVASCFVFTLSACDSGGGGGDSPTDGDMTAGAITNGDAIDDGNTTGTADTVADDDTGTDGDNDAIADEDIPVVVSTEPELQTLGLGDSITGSLRENEFITYVVPDGSQVLLTSDTGDSDIFLYETPEFFDDALVCADRSDFKEDICSGDGSEGILYATVNSFIPGDYTLSVTDDCSVDNINQWVYRSMQDYYLFADQVPTLNPLDYDSTSDLIEDLRFNELDVFSGARDAVARQALFEEGRSFGLGYRWGRDDDGNLRILNVDTDSPFGRAGVKRGDIFRSLGGISDEELSNEQFFDLIGTDEDPRIAEWTFQDGETDELETFEAVKAEFTVNTVAFSGVFTHPSFDGRTGYIVFNSFLNTSVEELDEVITDLSQQNITELVLDLRNNGGGRVSVAERLAAQLSGNRLTGQLLKRREYNDTYSHLDSSSQFADALPTLDLTRVIVMTTENTASSSEIVINSLKPYVEVVTIGERSLGKPFISNSREFCGISLSAMNSENVNASEVSAAGGIEATCFAEDDRTRDYGIGQTGIEGMLESALDYVVFGTCNVASPTIIASRDSLATTMEEWERTGEIEALGSIQDNKTGTLGQP